MALLRISGVPAGRGDRVGALPAMGRHAGRDGRGCAHRGVRVTGARARRRSARLHSDGRGEASSLSRVARPADSPPVQGAHVVRPHRAAARRRCPAIGRWIRPSEWVCRGAQPPADAAGSRLHVRRGGRPVRPADPGLGPVVSDQARPLRDRRRRRRDAEHPSVPRRPCRGSRSAASGPLFRLRVDTGLAARSRFTAAVRRTS